MADSAEGERLIGHDLSMIRGKDGWLFLRKGFSIDALGMYTGQQIVDEKVWTSWKEILEVRIQWCRKRGIDYVMLICPDAHWVYSDLLPASLSLCFRPLVPLVGAVRGIPGLMIIDPTELLRRGRKDDETYIRTDTHWTDYGAYLAYRALMARFDGRYFVRTVLPDAIEWRDRRHIGELGILADPIQSSMISVAKFHAPKARLARRINGKNRNLVLHEFVNDDPRLATCVCFRDSFGNALLPFLKESFGRLISVSSGVMLRDLLTHIMPDVVIYERAERTLVSLPIGDQEVTFSQLFPVDLREL